MKKQFCQRMQGKRSNIVAWLIFIAAIILMIVSIPRVWPLVTVTSLRHEAEVDRASVELVEIGHSPHFILFGHDGYMDEDEIQTYLTEAESRWEQLIEYLGISGPESKVKVRLHPQWGIPHFDPPATIELFGLQNGRNGLIHELTHLLMGYKNSFLSEGLAVVAEERYGWNLAFPNFLRPVDACLYAVLREGIELPPVSNLLKRSKLWRPSEPELSQMRYLQAGSFAKYLITMYGLPAFLEVYQDSDFEGVYGHTLDELETEWLAFMGRGYLAQAGILSLGGSAVLAVVHQAIARDKFWFLPAVVGWLSLGAWCLYLAYSLRLPVAILTAMILGSVIGQWRRSWGLVSLWLLGMMSLAVFIIWPALASYPGGM